MNPTRRSNLRASAPLRDNPLRIKAALYLAFTALCAWLAYQRGANIGLSLLAVFILLQAAPAAIGAINFNTFGIAGNNLGDLAATGILHDALGLTLKKLPFIAGMAKDIAPAMGYKQMPFGVAQILKNYNAAQQVNDRAETGTYAVQQGQAALADQNLTLNNWPYVSIKLSASEVNQIIDTYTNADARALVLKKLMLRGFNAFGTFIAQAYWNVLTAANFPNYFASPVGTMTFKELSAASDLLFQADVDPSTASAILQYATFREFANSLTALYDTPVVDEVVRTGIVDGNVSGLESVSRYNLNFGADIARGFIVAPDAVVMAQRLPLEETTPNDQVYLEPIIDPATGFSILYREYKEGATGEVTRTITTMLGFAFGLVSHAARITAA